NRGITALRCAVRTSKGSAPRRTPPRLGASGSVSRLAVRGPDRPTKLRSGFLGSRVVDEGAGAQFDTGKMLQPIGAAVGRIELNVQVSFRPAPAIGRRLMHRHHIRS